MANSWNVFFTYLFCCGSQLTRSRQNTQSQSLGQNGHVTRVENDEDDDIDNNEDDHDVDDDDVNEATDNDSDDSADDQQDEGDDDDDADDAAENDVNTVVEEDASTTSTSTADLSSVAAAAQVTPAEAAEMSNTTAATQVAADTSDENVEPESATTSSDKRMDTTGGTSAVDGGAIGSETARLHNASDDTANAGSDVDHGHDASVVATAAAATQDKDTQGTANGGAAGDTSVSATNPCLTVEGVAPSATAPLVSASAPAAAAQPLSTCSPATADTSQMSNAHPCPNGGHGDDDDNDDDDNDDSDPPEECTRLPAPNISAKHAIDYAAVCERIAHDLDHWVTAANSSADAAASAAAPAAHIERAVVDGSATAVTDPATGKLCSSAAMLQRVARARVRTAVARFEQHVVLMQLAAWVDARVQQQDALRLPLKRDRLTAALDDLVQHEPQRNRNGVWRETKAGRHWTALVKEFGIGVAALTPSCLGLSNRG
jgi:hypothetical protein